MEIKELVKQKEQETIDHLKTLVSYASIENLNEAPYPFGKNNADCLNAALKMCEEYGFRTKNLDNYCGYAEIGEGEEVIGVIGHLDVVPVSDGWLSDPFTAEIRDGKMYGRGTSDDKGPVCCSIAALKIVNELVPNPKKRIRLIMGCNEETGSRCLAHYVEKEGHVTYGFTPDGPFPLCHGEKGMVGGEFSAPTQQILNFHAGIASNVVPNLAVADVKKGSFDPTAFDAFLKSHNISYTLVENEDSVHLETVGESAHGSTPENGVNAAAYLLVGLKEAGMVDAFVDFFNEIIGLTYNGEKLGVDFKDDYGRLTLCAGVFRYNDGVMTGTIDIRFPVTLHVKDIEDGIMNATRGRMIGNVTITRRTEPLYFPLDSDLVKTLMEVYRESTGDMEHGPVTMGGGTYAKGIHNTVAFGASFPDGENTNMHNSNEFIDLKNISRQTEIYVHAILKLLEL